MFGGGKSENYIYADTCSWFDANCETIDSHGNTTHSSKQHIDPLPLFSICYMILDAIISRV